MTEGTKAVVAGSALGDSMDGMCSVAIQTGEVKGQSNPIAAANTIPISINVAMFTTNPLFTEAGPDQATKGKSAKHPDRP
jgi:hypothetical protein